MKRIAAAQALVLTLGLSGCNSLFFFPSREVFHRPEELGLRSEAVRFRSQDGTELDGLWLFSSSGSVRGTVVHFHGNGENLTAHFIFPHWLTRRGFDVLVFDYRGYGRSAGKPSLGGAIADGAAAIGLAAARGAPVAVWGQSLGGAIAVASVARSTGVPVRALVLESSFHSHRAIARDVLGRSWLTWPLQWLPWLIVSDRHKPARYLRRGLGMPVLVVHGDADPVVPFRFGGRLFAATRGPKEFEAVAGAGHAEAFVGPRRFSERERLVRFLEGAGLRPK